MSHEGSVWRSTKIDNMVKGLILAPILLSMVILDTPNTSNPCNVSSTYFQQNHVTNNCNQPMQLELSGQGSTSPHQTPHCPYLSEVAPPGFQRQVCNQNVFKVANCFLVGG